MIFEKSDNNDYSTKRYYITAKFDFLPVADNFPFDWQNIYVSQTSKNSKKYILQPTPQKLIDNDFDINFKDENIDLQPIISEKIIDNISLITLCMKDCNGLCVVCGKEQNSSVCQHREKNLKESPFSSLSELDL